MGDTLGVTLSHADVVRRRSGLSEPHPVLVLALECSRPGALSARWSLAGLAAIHLGRGHERKSDRTETELTVRVPDRWMSSRHARIENSFGRWVLVDTDSKNGTAVNGQPTRRAVLADGDVIELGHTLFLFQDGVPMCDDDPRDVDLAGATAAMPGLVTLMPDYGRELMRLREVATSEISVLIEGETGTGKEVLARAVHTVSGRPGAFVAVNCGALPPNLVESELFGYRKGAFSGANNDHPGLVRSADGGTLFLDEIGDLPGPSQAALLRVLQEREVMPIGGTRPVPVDLRVIAATHRDLDEMIASGQFRHDLFARLAGFRIEVPALCDRRADLGLLIGLLHARLFGGDGAAPHPGFDVEAARMLLRYRWPLNVRELEQALATSAVLAKTSEVTPEHLPEHIRTGRVPGAPKPAALTEADQKQRDALVDVLREHQGNISAVARVMGKDRKQIQRWIKRFGLDTGEFK
ncbi:MAG: sigma 54-interacting transcriptional regulator [Kofleriaceae bacterium]|nr:sigma 54-interacting transcriptional regulator [Myxococcales bacterium]MCB9562343.1 sigma 54-interacting transcriptional regulator [Kofleriaceae bacterium]MCB9572050.1 sigma 54-interacting transcriptional regulator [Kofleriaceae bacterium]